MSISQMQVKCHWDTLHDSKAFLLSFWIPSSNIFQEITQTLNKIAFDGSVCRKQLAVTDKMSGKMKSYGKLTSVNQARFSSLLHVSDKQVYWFSIS